MPYGDRQVSHKGSEPGFQDVPLHDHPADGIRTVQNDKAQAAFGACIHCHRHSGDIGIESRAYVLNVKNKNVETFQHLRRGFLDVAVKAVNRDLATFALSG